MKAVHNIALALSLSLAFLSLSAHAGNPQKLLEIYSNIALDNYNDSLDDARYLQQEINKFTADPTAKTLKSAKDAWLNARESYGQTEIFRLSNGPIDAEEGWIAEAYGSLEGQINAWPLDEAMIDYTLDANKKRTHGNIIDAKSEFTPSGENPETVNVSRINIKTITALNENGGEANVASGYHAIEFLLWGQDQDYNNFIEDSVTKGAMKAGQRPLSDFTSDKNAKRRRAYLKAATDKLVADLELVTSAWSKSHKGNTGLYRKALLGQLKGKERSKNLSNFNAVRNILAGMGVFIKSELANERIAVAVLTPSEEDEHSCFSDNTHRDIHTNYQGFKNLLTSTYNGRSYGVAMLDGVSDADKKDIKKLMADIEKRIAKINSLARSKMHFDYQIQPQNAKEVQNIVSLKNQLRKLGDKMVIVAKAYNINLSQKDVTDAEETKL